MRRSTAGLQYGAPLLGVAGICAVGWVIVEMGRLYNVWNYGDFMERFYGSKIVKVIFDVIQLLQYADLLLRVHGDVR